MSPKISLDQPGKYRIRFQGKLDNRWIDYFDGLEIETEHQGDYTDLIGVLQDQAAVQGALQKLYTLGHVLISVEKIA
jgi:hypothetical protein